MATLLSMNSAVGYVAAEDVYVVYSEYYDDGTIYGRVDILDVNGELVRGAGKSKKDLVEAGVVLSDSVAGSVGGDLVRVPDSNEPLPVAEESSPEESAPAPVSTPEALEECSHSGRYIVSLVIAGFTVTRELNVKINEETRHMYLSD